MLHRQDVAPRFQDDPVARPSGPLALRVIVQLALLSVLSLKRDNAKLTDIKR
jgi:hypothetical protein